MVQCWKAWAREWNPWVMLQGSFHQPLHTVLGYTALKKLRGCNESHRISARGPSKPEES